MLTDLPTRALYFTILIALVQQRYPCSVTSWWRTRLHNVALDGHPESFHLQGIAADLVLDNPEHRAPLKRFAEDLGLQAMDEGDHVHVELDYRYP